MAESCKIYITARKANGAKPAGSEAEVVTYSDADPLDTLRSIVERQPDVVGLDHEFATSSQGLALIERLRDDPILAHMEIVVVLADGTEYRYDPDMPAGAMPEAPAREPAKDGAQRRAPRVRIKDGSRVLVDGLEVELVDLSVVGAQVLCTMSLHPGKTVRVILPEDDEQVKVTGVVMWARFVMVPGQEAPRYRAGIAFTDPDPVAVLRYCARHRKDENPAAE
jgi:archaeosine-15-forming tRNA-guanine transglycosylase